MQSTLTKQADPHDVFLIESVLAACAKLAPSEAADRAASPPLAPQAHIVTGVSAGASAPTVDTTFRATAFDSVEVLPGEVKKPLERSSARKWVTRTMLGFVFTVGSAVAAAAWQQYGDVAMQAIAKWTPPFALASSPPQATRDIAGQSASSADQVSAVDATPAQPAPSAQPAQDIAPAVAAAAADPAPLPPSVAHDLAAMGQQIEELKASVEQLKAGQDQMAKQMSRDMAAKASEIKASETKAPEPGPHARLAALPRPAAPPVRKPRPAFSPAQAAAVPAAPVAAPLPPPPMAAAPLPPPPPAQPMTEPDGEPVLRPPMPLR
jgi:hypothetical protein